MPGKLNRNDPAEPQGRTQGAPEPGAGSNDNEAGKMLAEMPVDKGRSPLDVQYADESLLSTQIAQAENQLQMLQAEKKVLALKRKQLQANAERAKKMAEERTKFEADAGAEERVGELSNEGPTA